MVENVEYYFLSVMKRIIWILAAIMCCNILMPSVCGAKEWKAYLAYHDATYNIPVGKYVYSLSSQNLFSYHMGDTEAKTYSKSDGLSDCKIQKIAYCEDLSTLLLVYESSNIDIMDTDNKIINIPQYKNSDIKDKAINDINVSGKCAYLSTSFGVVVINMERAEYANSYDLGLKVLSCIRYKDDIYAISEKGVYKGSVNDNLMDKENWERVSERKFKKIILFNNQLYMLGTDALYTYNTENDGVSKIVEGNFVSSYTGNGKVVLCNANKIVTLEADDTYVTIDKENDFKHITFDGEYYWASRGMKGIEALKMDGDSLKNVMGPLMPNSPVRDRCDKLTYTTDNRLLIAGGDLAYPEIDYPGTIMIYDDGKWNNFAEIDSCKIITDKVNYTVPYLNITQVVEDPNNKNHHYASSKFGGVYEYYNGRVVNLYGLGNSPLETILPTSSHKEKYVRISGLTYDAEGNLWMFNNQCDTIVRILQKDKKTWSAVYYDKLKGYPTFDKYLFDSRGWIWFNHRRRTTDHQAGIFCIKYGGDINKVKNDKNVFCTRFVNEDNSTLTINELYDIVEDRNGKLWIATDKGPLLLNDPETIFDNPEFEQVKIARNDGTDYADYLLGGVCIKCIAIDGANRKWFGTNDDGVYLVSDDGTEIIHHFTKDNSPLLSNNINAIAIQPVSGLVMFATSDGLVSYQGDAITPEKELKENNIKVYPNPVRPDYQGTIKVSGFTFDSDVKITTATGQLVAQGKSLGGLFTWNGCNGSGDRVASGIYYVIASDEKGKDGVVAKILIIK